MIREHFACRETITTILADRDEDIAIAREAMLCARADLESYISSDPFFQVTYEPVSLSANAPLVVRRMADAGRNAGVGPMAAVAAAIAWSGVEAMQQSGASFGLIDNGGDIVVFSDRTMRIGIHAGSAPSSDKSAFLLPPQKDIYGVCTSSATVGPSVSFGICDAVVCFSKNPADADAWATSLCNRITPESFDDVIPHSSSLDGIYAVAGAWRGSFGNLPPIVPAMVDTDLITRG